MNRPNTHLSPEMKKAYIREQQIERYFNYLTNLFKWSRDSYVNYNHTEAAKKFGVSNMTSASLIKMGVLSSVGEGPKKIYKWKMDKPTEDLAERVWEKVKADQRQYILNKTISKPPVNKNGKALVPIKISNKIKSDLTETKRGYRAGPLDSTILNVYNFLNDIYINCKLGEVRTLLPFVLKYNVGRATPVVLRRNGYIIKNKVTKRFEWMQVEPDNEMAIKMLDLVKQYNASHASPDFKTETVSNTSTIAVIETKKVEVINRDESEEEVKNRLISKLLKAGKFKDAELLLDQMIKD